MARSLTSNIYIVHQTAEGAVHKYSARQHLILRTYLN